MCERGMNPIGNRNFESGWGEEEARCRPEKKI